MKYIKIGLAAVGVLIPMVAIVCLIILRSNLDKEQSELQTTFESKLQEIEESEDEVEYIEVEPYRYNTVPCNKAAIVEVLKYSNISDDLANVVGTAFATVVDTDLPWQIVYNYGYCAVYTLQFDGDSSPIVATCYTDDNVVVTTESSNYYVHNSTFVEISKSMSESLAYLLNQFDSWNWNESEATLILGKLSVEFPNEEVGVQDDCITLSGGARIRVKGGILHYPAEGYTGTLYAMYNHLQASAIAETAYDRSRWLPSNTLNIVSVLEVLDDNDITFSEDVLVDLFSYDLPPLLESWSYSIEDNQFVVDTVEFDNTYKDNINSRWLFTLDLQEQSYRKGY